MLTLRLNALRRELELGTLARVPLTEGYSITLPTAVLVRRAATYGAIVTAFLELLNEIYVTGRASAGQYSDTPASKLTQR